MTLDARIILAGQQPDIVNALARGTQTARMANDVRRQNALTNLFQQQGAQIAAGDQNALNALAGIDPMAARGIQQQDMANARADREEARADKRLALSEAQLQQSMERGRQEARKAARDEAKMAEQQREIDLIGKLMPLYQQGKESGDYTQFSAAAEAAGLPDASPGAFPGWVAIATGALEELHKMTQEETPKYHEVNDQIIDMNNPQAGVVDVPGLQQGDGSGMGIQVDPETGAVTVIENAPADFGRKAQNDIETRIVNSGAMLARLTDTQKLFKPEYQQIFPRVANAISRGKDKFGFATPEDQQAVGEFAQFKAEAFNNLNTTLKELSGAAVTPQEAERLLEQLPNVGTTIWNGDSPSEFQGKLLQSIKQQKLAITRYNLWLKMGRSGNPWDLGDLSSVPGMVDQYGEQLEQQFRQQGYTDQKAIEQMVRQQIQRDLAS